MGRQDLIRCFSTLGNYLEQHVTGNRKNEQILENLNDLFFEGFETIIGKEHTHNSWFTEKSVRKAIEGICYMLKEESLHRWMDHYPSLPIEKPHTIGVMMAGNIPLVGFHDLLCILMAGHHFLGKTSSKDERLIKEIAKVIIAIEPGIGERITFTNDHLRDAGAVIATGSNNSARYFQYYFRSIPHIIRKNRNGVAILTGDESLEDLRKLALDVFTYFGLGCRNVTRIWLPEIFAPELLMQIFDEWKEMEQYHSYMNNVSYYRTIYMMNREPFLDNGFLLMKESDQIASPVGVVYYGKYSQLEHVRSWIEANRESIQCVVSLDEGIEGRIAPGETQAPDLWDYADGVDTMQFLTQLDG